MRISIENSFPIFNMLFLSSEITSFQELYDILDKNKEDVILSPVNIEKIIHFFNCPHKNSLLSKQMLEEHGLFGEAIPDIISIVGYDLRGGQYINTLKTIHCFEIIDENIIEFIKDSKKDFYEILNKSNKNNIISKYSLIYEDCIKVKNILYNKKTLHMSVQFSVDYMLDVNEPEYFNFFKDKNCYFTINVDPYNKVRISMKTQYVREG